MDMLITAATTTAKTGRYFNMLFARFEDSIG
jgi:hypothetical protein